MRRPALSSALCALVFGCSTLTASPEGDRALPAGRGGPYRPLTAAEMGGQLCVVLENNVRYDDPSALADGDAVIVYATREADGRSSIVRTRVVLGARPDAAPSEVFAATLPWQSGRVAAPSVVQHDGKFFMAYATPGGLGIAESRDGLSFTEAGVARLEADPAAGESTPLGSPALVHDPAGGWVLAYTSGASIWAARADDAMSRFERLDAAAETPRRDPLVAPDDDGLDAGAPDFRAGSVSDPAFTVEETSAGRTLWRLFFTARGRPTLVDGGLRSEVVVGVAGSFDGRRYTVSTSPAFSSRVDVSASAPSVILRNQRESIMFLGGNCGGFSQRRGLRVAVAP